MNDWQRVRLACPINESQATALPAGFALAMRHLPGLLRLLPNLKIVVLAGKDAWKASDTIEETGTWPRIETYQMSARVWHQKELRERMVRDFTRLAKLLTRLLLLLYL